MKIKPFQLERYFAKYEFSVKYLLSSSDCDGLSQKELLSLADEETRKLWDDLTLGYTESLGHPLLRSEISKLYKNINSDNVLVVAPEEGIFITLNIILPQGDHVICTFPGYQSLYEIALSLGCEVTKWQPKEEEKWAFDVEFLRENIKKNTKLVLVNFPHNPTGYLPTKNDILEIVKICKDNDIYLFSDEMYHLLEFDAKDRLTSACDLYDNAITLFGMSKTFGMAGVRIGWIITKNEKLYKKMSLFKDYTTICSSAPSEILSIIALKAKDEIIEKHLKRINRNLHLLDEFFEKYRSDFEWVRPRAGTIAFPKLKGDVDSLEFCQSVVKNSNVMLLPSTLYDYDDKHFRIGFGRENMPEALNRFEEYLQK